MKLGLQVKFGDEEVFKDVTPQARVYLLVLK